VKSVEDFFVLLQPKGCGSGPEPQSRAKLREALADLVRAYEDPQVQDKLVATLGQCQEALERGITGPGSEGDWLQRLRSQLAPLQLSVARDHGFAASPGGLQRMQNAILRRICEGDGDFRGLANRALELLGVPRIGRLTSEVGAEELPIITQDRQALAASRTGVQELMRLLQASGAAVDERVREKLRRLEERRRPACDVCLAALAAWSAWERHGLPVRFACRPAMPEAGRVARLFRPSPDEVVRHVMENRPLVITGVLDARNFPPLEDFGDFEYLRSRCGHRQVRMKGDPSFDARGRKVYVNDPFVSLRLAEYLDMIAEAEQAGGTVPYYMGKVSLEREVPEMLEDVDAAPESPWKLYGHAFGRVRDGVHTYFGCGQNATAIHADPSENILVVVCGRKTFQLFPPCDADCLYPIMKKPLNSCVPAFTQPDDMPPDTERLYPNYRHARPMTVELEAGDMLYLPIFWWHGVAGGQGRNMILNWWCDMHPSKVTARPEPEGEMTIKEFVQGLHIPEGAG